MVDRMINGPRIAVVIAIGLLLLGPRVAAASDLADPTRPPNGQIALESSTEGSTASTALQSVLLSPGRNVAIINGETVRLGGRVGDARLIRITEAGIVLRHPDRDERLELLPGVEKRSRDDHAARRKAAARR